MEINQATQVFHVWKPLAHDVVIIYSSEKESTVYNHTTEISKADHEILDYWLGQMPSKRQENRLRCREVI